MSSHDDRKRQHAQQAAEKWARYRAKERELLAHASSEPDPHGLTEWAARYASLVCELADIHGERLPMYPEPKALVTHHVVKPVTIRGATLRNVCCDLPTEDEDGLIL
tara:strand:+ start:274 stop:594 length:321 start_codon:yes stop_codon:yes gene_type:complete